MHKIKKIPMPHTGIILLKFIYGLFCFSDLVGYNRKDRNICLPCFFKFCSVTFNFFHSRNMLAHIGLLTVRCVIVFVVFSFSGAISFSIAMLMSLMLLSCSFA